MEKYQITFGKDEESFDLYAGFTVVQPQSAKIDNEDGFCWLVWIDSDNRKSKQNEYLVHEIAHVVCEIIRYFEFKEDDDELRAYLTQYITHSIIKD